MTKLSVNINKIATLRNARGGNIPDVLIAAQRIQEFGAEGITVHPRPDERHIRYADVRDLRKVVYTEFNVEGYPSDDFLYLVTEVKPEQVTLVPDPPGVLTSNAGWDVIANMDFLRQVVRYLKQHQIRVSLFIDTIAEQIQAAAEIDADRIELYTENYAANYMLNPEPAIRPYLSAALVATEHGLGINAGHDLNLENLGYFSRMIPDLLEVSIGHALISDALYLGMANTVRLYKEQLI